MKTLLILLSALTFGCARLHAWPAVIFNPSNGVVMLPTNFVAANLSSVPVTNNFSGTATNLTGNALVQVTNITSSLIPTTATNLSGAALSQATNISLAVAQNVAATNQPSTVTNISGGALVQVTNIARSLIPATATNLSGAALTQVTNIAASLTATNYNASSMTNGNASTLFSTGIIPNQFLPSSSTYCGTITNLASVPFVVSQITVTNSTTNFLVVAGGFSGAGNFYASGGLYYGTNGYSFSYNSAAGGIWLIQTAGCNVSKIGSSSPIGSYGDNGCGAATVTQGTGTFTWLASSNVVAVASDTAFHFNLTTITNGIVLTNIYQ